MNTTRVFSQNDHQHGATAVEIAIILPLLILLLFGIIEFSIILYNQAMIANAAREGARFGVMYGETIEDDESNELVSYRYTESQIEAVVTTCLSDNLISFSSTDAVEIITNHCSNSDDILSVTVNYPYSYLVLPNFVEELSGPIILSSVANMKCEGYD